MIPWLDPDDPESFPSPTLACTDPDGLLCAGGDLSSRRLLSAYRQGIFPWFSDPQPILWWTPDPRMVLVPAKFRTSRSLRQALRRQNYHIKLDSNFSAVIAACANSPRGQAREKACGTWITPKIQTAYNELHQLGWAHSVEVWQNDELIGGLYGLAIGKVFYGESMFTRHNNASKIALAHLVRYLQENQFELIDCQIYTPHLASLGAYTISRHEFNQCLQRLTDIQAIPASWPVNGAQFSW